ncbi:MAG TPA: hypothetical protein ENH82_08070 [bacterium]|nr:hypothetical protein [bacterium]
MLITILATIGLFFIIVGVYRKGKRDGIKETIDFFVTEMNRKKIDFEITNEIGNMGEKPKLGIYKKMFHLTGRKK